jgi:uncharacterized protein YdbL (DUF1318 family)
MRAVVLALLMAGCIAVTVNVSFPQEKIESAASNIEDLVGGASGTPSTTPAPDTTKPQSWRAAPGAEWLAWLAPARAEAQGVPELKTQTPEVMAAIESRRKRNAQIVAVLAAGCLGENMQGLVEARSGQSCPADLGALVAAENADRMFIYKTLIEQNSMPPGDISRVQSAFAKARQQKVPAGTWIQLEGGQWTKK